jgi:hypothetical protein
MQTIIYKYIHINLYDFTHIKPCTLEIVIRVYPSFALGFSRFKTISMATYSASPCHPLPPV